MKLFIHLISIDYYIETPNQIQLQFYLWFGKLQIARYKVDKHELDWTCHKNGKFSDFDNFWKMVFTKSTWNNVMLNNILWVLGCFGLNGVPHLRKPRPICTILSHASGHSYADSGPWLETVAAPKLWIIFIWLFFIWTFTFPRIKA